MNYSKELIQDILLVTNGKLKEKWFFATWEKKTIQKDFSLQTSKELIDAVLQNPTDFPLKKQAEAILLIQEIIELTENTVVFSPSPISQKEIINHIRCCKSKMDLCIFTISDDKITEELKKAYKKGIQVHIITDNEKKYDKGSDIFELQKIGIPIRFDATESHMHHKFAIFDDKHILTGSYNWTRSAKLYNNENILITKNKAILKKYQEEFNSLWNLFKV